LDPTPVEHKALWGSNDVPATSEVGYRIDDGEQPATVHLSWREGAIAVWSWPEGGVVTEVFVRPGTVVTDGDPVIAVNGVTRIAQLSGEPQYRPISAGLAGSDVDWLDNLLIRRGISSTSSLNSSGATTAETVRAIRRYQVSIGAAADGVFKPEYTIWTPPTDPSGSMSVGAVSVQQGHYVEFGGAIASGVAHVVSASIESDAAPGRRSLLVGTPLRFSTGAVDIGLSGLTLSEDDFRELERVASPGEPQLAGSLRRKDPFHPGAVPSTALSSTADGQTCIILVSPDGSFAAELFNPLAIESSEPGVSYVPGRYVGRIIVVSLTLDLELLCDSR